MHTKTYCLLLFLACFFQNFKSNKTESRKLALLLLQDNSLRPVGLTKDDFWAFKDKFDTITISSSHLANRIENKINTLYSVEGTDISYEAAVIRYTNESVQDTIYTDRFFDLWIINGRLYQDKSTVLQKLFVNFFDGQIKE